MELSICHILFYVLAALALIAGICVVAARNTVTSAMSMALSFAFTAAILFGMGAQFMGIVQLIVYAGAILVLFLFVVMMLDLKNEESQGVSGWWRALAAIIIACVLGGAISSVALTLPGACSTCSNIGADTTVCSVFRDLAIGDAAAKPETAAPLPQPTPDTYGGPLPQLNQAVLENDTKHIGATLFTQYNIPFVILAFALLAGAVGAVALARKIRKD